MYRVKKFLALVRGAGPDALLSGVTARQRGFQILLVLVNGANAMIGGFAEDDDVHAPIRVGVTEAMRRTAKRLQPMLA